MKTSQKTKSDLILNIKDIERLKATPKVKMEDRAITIEKSMEKYNTGLIDALEAPVPNITLHYNEVLVRAVPPEIKTKGGIILSSTMSDIQSAKTLESMSHSVDFLQEILMVGRLITEAEQEDGIRPGRIARCKWDRYKTLDDDHTPGMINTSIKVPFERIDGCNYIIIDKRDILYTTDKKESLDV